MASVLLRFSNKMFNKQLRQFHGGASKVPVDMNKEKKEFQKVLPEVLNSLIAGPTLKPLPQVGSWVKQVLDYIMSGSCLNRGLIVSVGYRIFEDPEYFSEERQHSARVLGWCLEMACCLLVDDMIDGGTTRRGKPCWHLQQKGGPSAFNDSVLIYLSTMELLETNFGKKPFYNDLIGLINQTLLRASMGEHLDCALNYNKEKGNINVLTLDNYNTIVRYKTGFDWYRMPILTTLLLVNNGKEKATEELKNVCMELGRYFQMKDDYIDTYGNELLTGKAGRDIQEGKCSWLAITALQHCNAAQRTIFKEFYGSQVPEHVQRIKQLYNQLNLPQIYDRYERIVYDDLFRRIQTLPVSSEAEKKFLLEILNTCYRRQY